MEWFTGVGCICNSYEWPWTFGGDYVPNDSHKQIFKITLILRYSFSMLYFYYFFTKMVYLGL